MKFRYWLAGVLVAICLAVSVNAQVVRQVVNSIVATTCSANNWISVIAATGTGTCSQPAFTDISGAISNTQLGAAPTLWTPADGSGASLVFTGVSANYTRIGNMVFVYAQLTYPATADGSVAFISGAPVSSANANYAKQCNLSTASTSTIGHIAMTANSTVIQPFLTNGGGLTNLQLSGVTLNFMCIYPAS